jgi:hypothetical protein
MMAGFPNPPPAAAGGAVDQVQPWNPFSWFRGAADAAGNWLGGIGGNIASGIEGGFAAVLIDSVKWVIPYLEIIVGAVILLWVLGYILRDEVVQLGGMIVRAVI